MPSARETIVRIVAAAADGGYATALREELSQGGVEASVDSVLPDDAGSKVVLVWSDALAKAQAIDAPSLVELWADGRLVTIRSDATELPLGLRDLPTLERLRPREIANAILQEAGQLQIGVSFSRTGARAAQASRGSDVPVFSRSSGRVETEAPLQPKPRVSYSRIALRGLTAVVATVLILGGGAYWYLTAEHRARQAELTSMLEAAAKAAADLRDAKEAEVNAQKRLAEARASELEAIKQGDVGRARELEEARKRAEVEAAKQAEIVRRLAAAASEVRAAARKSVAAVSSSKADVTKSAPRQVEAPKVEAPKVEAPKAEAAISPREPVQAAKAKTRSEREPESVAAAAAPLPTGRPAVAPAPGGAPSAAESLFAQAQAIESTDAKGAVKIYRSLARKGYGKAAKRLGDIYDRGIQDVPHDYQESLSWYQKARDLGETVEMAGRHPESPKAEAPKPPQPAPEDTGFDWAKVALALAVFLFAAYGFRRFRKPPAEPVHAAASAPASAADAPTLFVSYSHKDKARIEPLVRLIEQTGRAVWMDRTGITGQAGWAGQIVRAIRQCRAVVLMASPNSYASDQVVRELYLAMNHKKPIVPIEIEPADLPDELQYILAPFQHHRLSGGETREVLGRALAAV